MHLGAMVLCFAIAQATPAEISTGIGGAWKMKVQRQGTTIEFTMVLAL